MLITSRTFLHATKQLLGKIELGTKPISKDILYSGEMSISLVAWRKIRANIYTYFFPDGKPKPHLQIWVMYQNTHLIHSVLLQTVTKLVD